ncbi:YjjG family noncanonical pyrimidine nucleotidase [Flavobacterium sp. CBA20B-1]|uniref:YjjG family noncanonical pyrimidine nucleotidase n=1 Tax=unclassified Flavobacterium TaxID=196869 RepID=UPI002223FC9A|nr:MULTISPECIES: YjjG family noncanonical pyrimidine nucleotidase [unclassified Flavobacterium]WCM43270.1 YjjG family noncanonical pyrimidine nucleotidase [Flavobacterium sp. CBA20B-1]
MIQKEHITDLFFDLDHTIYDFDKNSALTFQAIFTEMQLIGVDDFMTHFKPINDYYWDRFSREEISRDFLRYGRLKDTFAAMNVKIEDNHIYYIADEFIGKLPNHNHVFDGAYETLNVLKNNYRLHIITNGPDVVQEKKLKNANLTAYFQTITNSEIAGVKKPHPGIFQHALTAAKTKANTSLMIGDNLNADVHGAINVGMQAVWFNEFKLENTIGVAEVQQLNQLLDIL